MSDQTINLACVPEHFNVPFFMAKERGLLEKHSVTADMNVIHVKEGSGKMLAGLRSGEFDVIIALTDCIVAEIEKGRDIQMLAMYVTSPLVWGISMKPNNDQLKSLKDLEGKTFGISRYGSGSHIMVHVLAAQQGWSKPPQFVVCNNFQTLKDKVNSGETDAFLWEKFTTKPWADSGEVEFLGEIPTPWPCFAAAILKSNQSKAPEIKKMISAVFEAADNYKKNIDVSVARISQEFGLTQDDAKTWLERVNFSQDFKISKEMLNKTRTILTEANVLEGDDQDKLPFEEYVVADVTELI